MPWVLRYRWIIFINPNYYGLSAVSVILLSDYESECERNGGSEFECYPSSGDYVLTTYDFGDTNPYFNIVVSVKDELSLKDCSTDTTGFVDHGHFLPGDGRSE